MYIVYLEPTDDLPGGYYVGHGGINHFIYGRGEENKAVLFNKQDAKDFMREAREYDYPCNMKKVKGRISGKF